MSPPPRPSPGREVWHDNEPVCPGCGAQFHHDQGRHHRGGNGVPSGHYCSSDCLIDVYQRNKDRYAKTGTVRS